MEDRPQINLYIETSIKGPKIQDGEYIYVLEYIVAGVPVTRAGRWEKRRAHGKPPGH